MDYKVISFYKYTQLKNPHYIKEEIRNYCLNNNLLGRILIAQEGINGAASGKAISIENFKNFLKQNPCFSDLSFREQECPKNSYHKLVVRIRKEIVAFGEKVNLAKKGDYLLPEELNEMLDKREDITIIDARNEYEASVGKFENAIVLPIKTFREFPKAARKLSKFKKKRLLMYCTGGIRCEKASAYLREKGFKNVFHLQGGIINYVNEFPDSYYKGGCFVFDDRLVSHVSKDKVSSCTSCNEPCDILINCHNMDCDKLIICCEKCQQKMQKCCSLSCMDSPRQRREKRTCEVIGRVVNYFPKAGTALIDLAGRIEKNLVVSFAGKTTKEFQQKIGEIRDYEENKIEFAADGQLITIPVLMRVRENDSVIVYT